MCAPFNIHVKRNYVLTPVSTEITIYRSNLKSVKKHVKSSLYFTKPISNASSIWEQKQSLRFRPFILFSIEFFYIYIDCRKSNAEFNQLIKTVVHRARIFEKWCWTHQPLPIILTLFGYFHILTYEVLKL